jgi:FSR family fosmidomycin resistance protein-like MFS transporter
MVVFPWKIGFVLGFVFTLGVIFGKSFGWVLADKFGFGKVWITSLLISSFLLSFWAENPYLWILWIFLFNMTMPITLVVISNTLKGRQGFAFGLTTLALIIWALPYYSKMEIMNNFIIFGVILSSVFAVYVGLIFYKKYFKS